MADRHRATDKSRGARRDVTLAPRVDRWTPQRARSDTPEVVHHRGQVSASTVTATAPRGLERAFRCLRRRSPRPRHVRSPTSAPAVVEERQAAAPLNWATVRPLMRQHAGRRVVGTGDRSCSAARYIPGCRRSRSRGRPHGHRQSGQRRCRPRGHQEVIRGLPASRSDPPPTS